ncbi:MAG: isoprenylcysteine carboxylmethyltransferase family protein [Gammaproteobacteria bacterium]|nr:isoprenylcysteine carboxylmethyltransferase family protein [Gammaproteobacteria bacterium]
MFSFNLSSDELKLLSAVLSTVVVASVFLLMMFSYTKKRSGQCYAVGKKQAPSLRSFQTLSKFLFISSMLLALLSYWFQFDVLLIIHNSVLLQLLGMVFVFLGYVFLVKAFKDLGDNYSPLFDAYLPKKLVTTGAYRMIRHPVYLFNLFVSFGLVISSGSLIVLVNAIIGLFFVIKSVHLEEEYLIKSFPEYRRYSLCSWRFIPYLY